MDISVTIVTCNRAASLARSLAALAIQDFDRRNFEVIVADNGSTDHTKAVCDEYIHQFAHFKYIFDARPGQLVGWHQALEIAQGDITCFIDDDVRPTISWLSALNDAYAAPDVGMATGPITLSYKSEPPDWLSHMTLGEPGSQTLPYLGLLDIGNKTSEISGNFVWGSNFSVRRELLKQVGGFHPCAMPSRLLHFYGDGEIHVGREVTNRGHKVIYHPSAKVVHDIPAGRLTLEAVEKKFQTTGYARSFQTLRRAGDAYEEPSADEINEICQRYFRDPGNEPAALRQAVVEGLSSGFTRHLDNFKNDPAFRDWVLRENYLDLDTCYSHPDLTGFFRDGEGDWRSGD